tara:strand:+ start:144 stop:341 length:198 start_codon:yes stop_codon:yes gene_type:complete
MEEIKEEIKAMDEGDSKELLKAAHKVSLKKAKNENSKGISQIKRRNAKMRKMFRSFSKINLGVRG